MGKVIAVTTNKGGVLKTSMTTNLAGVLCKQGKKVLLIDTDNQGNVCITFGQNPDHFEKTLFDVLVDGLPMADAVVPIKGQDNLFMVPANDELSVFELEVLPNPQQYPQPFMLLKNALAPIKDDYDYILIDTPPNLGIMVANVMVASDQLILPYHPETYSMRSVSKTIAVMNQMRAHNPQIFVRAVVPTKVKRTNLHQASMLACEAYCAERKIPFAQTVVPESIRYPDAVGRERMPLVLTKSTDKTVKVYHDLAKELAL